MAITGASGSIYAQRVLFHLAAHAQEHPLEVGVVYSKNALDVWQHELGGTPEHPFSVYDREDYFAPFASGSAQYEALVIVPCSMGTVGRIAGGFSDDLITRAADVMLKEQRQLICIVRDTPYNTIHLQNMLRVAQAGGTILPATPSFYSKPADFDALADTVVLRALDLLGIDRRPYRWGG